MKMFIQLLLVLFVACLSGCSLSGPERNVKAYMKTFDDILTDQYIWSYGRGGIYWVSNEHVVLEAHIKDDSGSIDRGIYQVDVRDGSYLKVVDVPEKGPFHYKYCFDGGALHVVVERGDFKQVNTPKDYQVIVREKRKKASKSKRRRYSPLRCQFVDSPLDGVGYSALRSEDGFIKFERNGSKRDVYLVDESGSKIKRLIEQDVERKLSVKGMFEASMFLEVKNSYFGYSSWDVQECTELWWLSRVDWSIDNKQVCLSDRILGGSRLLHDLKTAVYLEHYGGRKGRSYVLKGDKEILIESGHGRGASVSPNGCLVAYGIDDDKAPVRQKLKLFNYCEYQKKELGS